MSSALCSEAANGGQLEPTSPTSKLQTSSTWDPGTWNAASLYLSDSEPKEIAPNCGLLPPSLVQKGERGAVAHPSEHSHGTPMCQQHPQASLEDIQLPIPGSRQVLLTWEVPSELSCQHQPNSMSPCGTKGLAVSPFQPSSAWTAQGRTQTSALMPSAPSHTSAIVLFPGLTAISDLQISMCVLHTPTHLQKAQTSH